MAGRRILVQFKPMEEVVGEDWTEEQIMQWLDYRYINWSHWEEVD